MLIAKIKTMRRIINVMLIVAALNGVLCSYTQISADTTLTRLYERDSAAIASSISERVITWDDVRTFSNQIEADSVITPAEQQAYFEMIMRSTLPSEVRAAPITVFVDTVTIENPYILENNNVFYLIAAKDLDFDNPDKSLKTKPCYALIVASENAIVFAMHPKLSLSLAYANLLDSYEGLYIDLYKNTSNGKIYRYDKQVSKFLITLVQIRRFNEMIYHSFDEYISFGEDSESEAERSHPVVKNDMPYSQYILVASPLMPDKGK